MTGPFGDDELFEDEWVDVYDVEGRKTSLRHLATVRLGDKTYMVLGSDQEDALDEKSALMLVREDQTVDGAIEYVVAHDEQEIERVVGQFVKHLLMEQMNALGEEAAEYAELPEEICGCCHRPGEFCYCNAPDYLQ